MLLTYWMLVMTASKVKQGLSFLAHFPVHSDELFFADQTDHSDDERTAMTTLLLQFVVCTAHTPQVSSL